MSPWKSFLCALLLGVLVAVPGSSGDTEGRDFAAFYETAVVTDMVSEVALRMTMDVYNYSGEDVYNAAISVTDSLFAETTHGTFYAAYIADRDKARVSGEIVVPSEEYEQWKQGAPPRVWIDYEDAGGHSARAFVEMAPMVLGEEE